MKQTTIFRLIQMVEQMNNSNIMRFTKAFRYPIGISPILALSELKTKGPQKQAELAETVGVTKGAMTSIAAKLVELGLAERLYDENDRRTIQLSLTAEGKKALVEAQEIGQEVYMELFGVLSEEEVGQYLSLQEKLIRGIEERKIQ